MRIAIVYLYCSFVTRGKSVMNCGRQRQYTMAKSTDLFPLPNSSVSKYLGVDVNFFKIGLILYADDIVIFADSKDELQQSFDVLQSLEISC